MHKCSNEREPLYSCLYSLNSECTIHSYVFSLHMSIKPNTCSVLVHLTAKTRSGYMQNPFDLLKPKITFNGRSERFQINTKIFHRNSISSLTRVPLWLREALMWEKCWYWLAFVLSLCCLKAKQKGRKELDKGKQQDSFSFVEASRQCREFNKGARCLNKSNHAFKGLQVKLFRLSVGEAVTRCVEAKDLCRFLLENEKCRNVNEDAGGLHLCAADKEKKKVEKVSAIKQLRPNRNVNTLSHKGNLCGLLIYLLLSVFLRPKLFSTAPL